MSGRRHQPVLPGFKEMAEKRHALGEELGARRRALGLSQTQIAARMGTSQSAVARLESGELDVRLSTLERYAAALGGDLELVLRQGGAAAAHGPTALLEQREHDDGPPD